MSSKLKRLGSLADIYQSEHLDGTITKLKLDKVHPSTEQPRQDRTVAVDELAASIAKDGLLSPLVVTRDGDGYRVIAGERRFHALKKLGWTEAECRIISREERDYYRIAIIENLQRENLSPEEEASALLKLKLQENYSDADLAQVLGKSRNYITEILGIASLPKDIVAECAKAGINNRNMLIQAVQAQKKGKLPDFMKAVTQGNIKTIRDARSFNQEDAVKAPGVSQEKKSKNVVPIIRIESSGSTLKILCQDAKEAKIVEDWMKKHYPSTRK